jgi:glycolate oxidase
VIDFLTERGWFLPQLVGSALIASLGGLASNNTSGHVIDAAIGKIADYIHGVEVVLPTGEIIETGTKGMRRPAGTDLTKYFVGGDGLLAVITKIRYRLVPLGKQAYGIAIFKDLKQIARGVKRMYTEKVPPPLFMEFMDHKVSTIAYSVKNMEPPPGPVIFFVGYGEDEDIARKKMNRVLEVFKGEKPVEAYQVTDQAEWRKLWSAREVIAPYLMKANEGILVGAELVANLAQLEEAVEEGSRFQQGIPYLEDTDSYYYGHIGALTMHSAFVLPPTLEEEKLRKIVTAVFQKEKEFNLKYGTCGGEWGQFSKRKEFFVERYGDVAYGLVKKIKAAFDPNNILNPGILEGYR